MSEEQMCPCGRPLHYPDPTDYFRIRYLSKDMENINVVSLKTGKTYSVSRHFIALHGIKIEELDRYGVEGVYRRAGEKES